MSLLMGAVLAGTGFGGYYAGTAHRMQDPAPATRAASHTAPAHAPSGGRGAAGRHGAPSPVVAVGHPVQAALPVTLSFSANIASMKTATMTSPVAGNLQAVNVRPGDTVQAGEVLAIVDHSQLDAQVAQAQAGVQSALSGVQTAEANAAAAQAQVQNAKAGVAKARASLAQQQATSPAQLQQAEAQVASARANLASAQSDEQTAATTLSRDKQLLAAGAIAAQQVTVDTNAYRDAQGKYAAAQAALNAAQAAVATAEAGAQQVQAAQADVAQSEEQVAAAQQQANAAQSQVQTEQAQVAAQAAALRNAQVAAGDATITAPFSGNVTARNLDPGAYVGPSNSTAILTIADLDHLKVVVNVGEDALPALHAGDRAQIRADAFPGRTFQGVVSRIASGIDATTRTAQVEIDIQNPGHRLQPGMSATARLTAGSHQALLVPLSALVDAGSTPYVWVVQPGSTVTQRFVSTGQTAGSDVEITSGLTPADLIVTRGTDMVQEGQHINAVPRSQPNGL
jgi:HlyD family secretion protein